MKFIDEVQIYVCGGKGGRGCVSFAREKYRPWGGPDGGNGGRGGDVYLCSHSSFHTLAKLLRQKRYKASNGQDGRSKKQNGQNGKALQLYVPIGTEILKSAVSPNPNTQDMPATIERAIVDLAEPGALYLAAKGGRGGLGNHNFATSTRQKPEYAQPGETGEESLLTLRLKLLADVGLAGMPNAGKTSLLAAVSEKKSKIASYAFTTLLPNIGLVRNKAHRRLYLADIPGIIKGASRGQGLGLSFLRHIERVQAIVYLIDAERFAFEEELQLLQEELRSYKAELLQKKTLVAINKSDLIDYDETLQKEIRRRLQARRLWHASSPPQVLFISAKEGQGLDALLTELFAFFPKASQAEKDLQMTWE